ncbi:ECF RNA polymerase sigma factor SigH [termite gut metagenome]|uniref:ECF RNA polymerase sigma factor SigH n=1 Tax=termite gut metagenome TaxID=433724 RepID=A0A5J4SS23_9ZZZZ
MKNSNSIVREELGSIQDDLFRFAYKLTANREDAGDLLQETSLRVLDNEDKYIPGTNFKAWVYTIMRNTFINNYRRGLRVQTYIDSTDGQFYLNSAREEGINSTDSTYDLKEMYHILGLLPKIYKVPFAMFVSGFKYREIAGKLSLPIGTVKSRICFTRRRLQVQLKDFI